MQQYLRSSPGNTRQNQWQHYMTNNDKTSFHSTLVSMTVKIHCKIQMHHGSTWQSPLFIKVTARQPLIWWKEHPSWHETASPTTGAERSSLEILGNERRPKTTFCWKATDATCCPYKDKGWKLGRGQPHSYTVQQIQASVIHAQTHISLMWAGGQFCIPQHTGSSSLLRGHRRAAGYNCSSHQHFSAS